ncbi:MAG: nucleoside-diphosphate sugar epimerase/dehydratase [Phycisphaerae bacterium]|jgi:FlaA1/EpsC-like NDP-sugar epimerase|nr:nucleoside-diphosphate sugar epimerase/dehydratase [Phycisphaerae bacterium]
MADSPETQKTRTTDAAGKLTWLEANLLRHHLATHVVIHAVLFALSLLSAFLLWFDINASPAQARWAWMTRFLTCLPFYVIVKLLIFGRMKLFHGGWQYASIRDVANILLASWWFVAAAFALWGGVYYLPHLTGRFVPYVGQYFMGFPKAVLVLDFLATVFWVCTARLGFRLYREELRPIASEGLRRVLVVGAGNAAEAIIREVHRMRTERYRVIGMVDDDAAKRNILIHGVPVLGTTEEIREICDQRRVEEIIIALPDASRKELQRVIDLCSGTKLKFQSLPGVADLIDGRVTVSQIRPVDINDLLGREVVELDDAAVSRFLRGRRILITGAGGSIGAEMCRQVCRYQPARLILVEQAETPLFEIDNELRRTHGIIPVDAQICDIFDRRRVMEMWARHRPEVVVHAAAHKHVPLMEHNPCEAIKNNIMGSKNVADASCRYDTAEFVMISTDKAVNPSSVMGASKRMAEIYTQALNGRDGCATQFKAVRFGNVLDSSGSVIPTFRKQIAAGGPVSVTHPQMRRYFMTIPEASRLVLQAAATGVGGQIFLLDMGEPVKIVDLARQMITLSGFRPGEDIEIEFVGPRPGEKLFEELRTGEEHIAPTIHPKVHIWKSRPAEWNHVQDGIMRLEAMTNCPDRQPVVDLLRQIIPEYDPLNPPEKQKTASLIVD